MGKINFLKKTKMIRSDVDDTSIGPLDRLPDELLFHIFSFIPPVNMDNFVTFLALEMVSKRFHRCVADNRKIVENTTELVIGFHPHLPDDQYLCHIRHYTMIPFIRKVKKITKLILNVNDNWTCYFPLPIDWPQIDHLFRKVELQELILCEYLDDATFVTKLINCSIRSLENAQINVTAKDFSSGKPGFCVQLAKCSNLKYLTLSMKEWDESNEASFEDFSQFVNELQSLEVLEVNGYFPGFIEYAFDVPSLHTVRFKYPSVKSVLVHNSDFNLILDDLHYFIDYDPESSINEVEIHICPLFDDLIDVPGLFDFVSHPIHLKMTFLPCLEIRHLPMIAFLLFNAQLKNIDDTKISITFMHSDVDQEEKLSFVHNLLDLLIVPYGPEEKIVWEFNKGKLAVNLKLEMIEDESLICHITNHWYSKLIAHILYFIRQ